ncbi:ArsR/SmtB family transcription factor [Dyadobacter endophyticus]|uniref:Transcriptional regulator n=1 Tax=Dyadobacter endophyticus TaxID=1749036 RepID=A0ABQ1Z3I1_9BACT|nr:metalloregulator ArsR/SmtB family transcription factor [Dyadobacter endophyticus]GGH45755.1 transcriptional regulator [Dyadobacter endophyticus]
MSIETVDAFQALADPGRREILMMVAKEKRSINAIAENFDISRPAVSKHIKILQNAGFINIEEKGRERYCVLNQSGFSEVQQWISTFEQYWTAQFRSLESYLAANVPVPKK